MKHPKHTNKRIIEATAEAERYYVELHLARININDHEPRCNCGHLFEICNHPCCHNGGD